MYRVFRPMLAKAAIETVKCAGLCALIGCTGQVAGNKAVPGARSDGATDQPGSDTTAPGATTPASGDAAPSSATPASPSGTTASTGTAPTAAGGAGSGVDSPAQPLDCTATDTSPSVLRRLSRLEYQLTLKELFQLEASPDVSAVEEDKAFEGFRTAAELQNVSTQHLRAYADVTGALTADLFADAPRRDAVIGCAMDAAGCLDSFVAAFGRLSFRRPLEEAEVTGLVSRATEVSSSPEEQFSFAIEALLTSPSFLFRVEVGDSPEGLSTLSPLELASRLSFTVHGRAPSAELLTTAEQGGLDTPEGLAATAAQMLAEPAGQEFFTQFFRQWLDFEQLRVPPQPPAGWSDALLDDMTAETDQFFNDFAWGAGANFLEAFTANYTYLTPALATFYGLPAPASGLSRVDFPAGDPRENSGLLTHASLLSAKSDGDLVAHRGAWIRRSFLCESLEVPTEVLNSIGDELAGLGYFEVVEKRNTELACAGCHALIDPIGVGFVHFDGVGKYQPDADMSEFGITPALPGNADPEFSSIGELSGKLVQSPELAQCIAERVFFYTAGRKPLEADACTLQQAGQRFATDQYNFGSLLLGFTEAPEFRLRRAPELAP